MLDNPLEKNILLGKIIFICCILSFLNSSANETKYIELNKKIAALNEKQNYEETILILENIISNKNSSPDDLYNAHFQKYILYKSLFNYVQALNNLDLALEAGLKTNQKEKVQIRYKVERIIIHFDLLEFDKVIELTSSITRKDLEYLDQKTIAFYLSILGTLEMRKNNFNEAEKYLDEAEQILLKANPKHLPLIYRKKLGLYRLQKQHDKAIESFKKGLYYAEKYNITIYIIAMYDDISQFYSEIGDMENAFLAQNKIKLLSTEYDATNKSGKLQLLEKDLLQKSKEIDSQNKNRILLTLIITLVVILAFLFFYTKFTKTKNSLATIEIENIRKDLEKITKELDNAGQSKLNLDNYKLTERQSQIITLVKQGKTNKEIGQSLFISENTVKYHLKIIYETLNIANRSEL